MGVRVLWLEESLLGSELFGHASGRAYEKGLDLGLCWTVLPSFFFDDDRIEDPPK